MTLALLIFKMLSDECERACQSILAAPRTEDSAFTYVASLFYFKTLSVARCSCRPLVELAARTRCSLKEAYGESCVPRLAIALRTADFRGRVLAL